MFENVVKFIKKLYGTNDFIPLHVPTLKGNEKKYLNNCIDTTFVSSVGEYVNKFEEVMAEYTGSKYAVAAVNGTNALHIALKIGGVNPGDEVITQPLTFVATANAISYCNAKPVFTDVNKTTLGMSPEKLEEFLKNNTLLRNDGFCYNKSTDKKITACVPMHTFGHPVEIEKIINICTKYNIAVIEDAAESLGSYYKKKHTGTFGKISMISFNGNKIVTCGSGGVILTNDEKLAKRAKHITTTAKLPHKWEYVHDEIGYNYRLSNLNAALGCAQMENLPLFLKNKRELALKYKKFFESIGVDFVIEPKNCKSNYWLNAVVLKNKNERDEFLKYTNENGVMTRPSWRLMNKLEMFKNCQCTDLENAEWIEERLVNIPSTPIL